MPFDESTAGRVRTALGRSKKITEKKMFGGLAFMYRGNMLCGVLNNQLVLRLGDTAAQQALAEPHVRPMDFTGKPMKSMVYVTPAGFGDDRSLKRWLDLARAFVTTLPPK